MFRLVEDVLEYCLAIGVDCKVLGVPLLCEELGVHTVNFIPDLFHQLLIATAQLLVLQLVSVHGNYIKSTQISLYHYHTK